MSTLFQISDDLLALAELLDECEGDISRADEIQSAVMEWIAELETDQGTKLDSYRALLRKWESEIAVAKAMQEQYRKEAQTRENRIRYMKERMKDYMLATGQKRIETPELGVIQVVANGGKLPILPEGWAAVDPATVPDRFCETVRRVVPDKVREALESGESLPFAALGERGNHLRVK